MKSAPLPLDLLDIPLKEIYSFMGYGTAVPDNETVKMTEELLAEASELVFPQFEYVYVDGTVGNETVRMENTDFETGKVIASKLKTAERFIAFVASVGTGWGKWQDIVGKHNDVFRSYVADCIGSQLVESTADYMEKVIQEELDLSGLRRTNRYSPGYCGWHVSQQPLLFGLFPDRHPCGVSLTESCLMVPIKSVSGIIGIGHNVKRLPYGCGICGMKTCSRRRG